MFRFNIRVYGILRDSNNRVLVSDEFIRGDYFTKFPGGGLEFGEGTRDCLAREFMEETGLTVTIGDHIYTTDHFQLSAFNKEHQIFSIYYFVHAEEPIPLVTKTKVFDFEETKYVFALKAFEHQTHHRGQCTIYIRLLGIRPPQERLF